MSKIVPQANAAITRNREKPRMRFASCLDLRLKEIEPLLDRTLTIMARVIEKGSQNALKHGYYTAAAIRNLGEPAIMSMLRELIILAGR
jgi:hypothetical protein